MRLWIFTIALSFALHAQTGVIISQPFGPDSNPAPKPATPVPPEDLCTVQGQVVNTVTGEPLKKANLNLQRTDMTPSMMSVPTSYSTSTDASGKFAMKDIESGKYLLTVMRNGFVTTTYGSRGPFRPGTTISLSRGQNLKEVNFRLTPHGVVTGRIVDEDGEPVASARVQLMTYRYQQARKTLMPSGAGNTDDLGEYRIFGIAPGKYYLSATAANQMSGFAQDRSAAPPPEEDYVPTYYPGTTEIATAAQLNVTPGGQLRDITLRLSKARTVHVKGHVTYSVTGNQRVVIYLQPRALGMLGGMGLRPTQVDAKGDFDIRGVAPGQYSLTAMVNDGSKSYQGRLQIDVGSSNIERANVTIGPGIEVAGKVRIDGTETTDLANVRIMLQPREFGGMMFGGVSQGKISDDRAFKLQDVAPGLFNLALMGLPPGFYVKSIRSGDTDVLSTGLNTEVAPAPLEVVLSPNAAQVTGSVQNPSTNSPMAGATVVLIPQEKERKEQQAFYKVATSDQNGAFTLRDVQPGDYRVFAWEDMEAGAYMDPDYVKPVENKGEALTLRESDKKSLQLTLIPADAANGAQRE